MIELKNVSKTYHSKKGSNTNAISDISIVFEEKGVTFLLGKSGSGKSTLLNILGGLDRYDSGDMLVFGKSSKEFQKKDWDSYRNTYIGFVFQEYNLLEDYNVYENVILALQLQKKKVDKLQVMKLLKKLELDNLALRKVNELSGGQKQRVAIARALIKDPKIILADEPTGNLDSKTGKQVLDLLKEISREKLVIIVSHDQEAATTYGDRIIEIKDGSIITDTKNQNTISKAFPSYQVISSQLPIIESFKLGIGSLKHKKIKLAFTILLCVFSLLFLCVTDTLSNYQVNLAHSKLLKQKEEEFVQIEKYSWYEDDYVNRSILNLTSLDIRNIQKRIDKDTSTIYRIRESYGYSNIYEAFHISSEYDRYGYNYGNFDLEMIETSNFDYLDKFQLIGRKPDKENEIVISNMIADLIIANGITPYQEEEKYFPNNYQELLTCEKTFYLGNSGIVKIVGIIDYDHSKYDDTIKKVNEQKWSEMTAKDNQLYTEYLAKMNNIYNKVFVKKGFVQAIDKTNCLPLSSDYSYNLNSDSISLWQEGMYIPPSLIHENLSYYDGNQWIDVKELKKNEIVLNANQLKSFDSSDYRQKLIAYINQNLDKPQLEAEKEFFQEYIKNYDIYGKTVNLKIQESFGSHVEEYRDFVVVGITGLVSNNENYYYLSREFASSYEMDLLPVTGLLVLENSQSGFKKLMDEFPYDEKISLKSTYSYDVLDMIRTIEVLKKIAFYVGIILTIFTVILIANFMFSSMNYRKREIGILRGLGARNSDIIKIFLWEGIVLAGFSFLLTSIILIFTTHFLNELLMNEGNLLLTPFIVTIRQFIIIFLLVYGIVLFSSILPIIKISHQKPIDAILKK